jgi:hypothetical protein
MSKATAKEDRKGGENRANRIDHKSPVTRCVASANHWFAAQMIEATHQQHFDYAQPAIKVTQCALYGHP